MSASERHRGDPVHGRAQHGVARQRIAKLG